MNARSNRLVDQEKALESFFDSLLRDVEAYAQSEIEEYAVPEPEHVVAVAATYEQPVVDAKPVTENKPVVTTVLVEAQVPSIFETLPEIAPPQIEVIEEPDISPVVQEVKVVTEVVEHPAEVAATTEHAIGKPVWADSDFQAMLFKVAGLTLAVPLVDLNGVIEWNEERVTEMPGHADFYLGLMNHLGKNIPLVDTARLVLPPDKIRVLAGDNPLAHLSRIVLIHDSDYGLACDEVNEVITLRPDDVRWRTSRTQRRWLAGTVIQHMCALIDANAFAQLLRERASVAAFRE
jgi:purine-binding chemotaxis protein CheW